MDDDRLTRRALITILLSGLVTAVVALVVVAASGVLPGQVFRAQSVVLMSPAVGIPPGENSSLWTSLDGGTQSQIAARIFALPKYRDQAAAAAGVTPDQLSVTAGVVESSVLINIKVDAPTAVAAETAADKIVELAKPEIANSVGKFQINAVQPAAGTATPAGIPAGQMLVVVFIGGLLVGSGGAFVAIRARGRKQEAAAYESGEFRQQTPPPRAPQRPVARPGGAARRPDGAPAPRRPAGDPPRQR